MLPNARIVADPFHVVRGAGEALDSVRRARQRELRAKATGRKTLRATWNPRLYRARHLLLRGKDDSPHPNAGAFASSLPTTP